MTYVSWLFLVSAVFIHAPCQVSCPMPSLTRADTTAFLCQHSVSTLGRLVGFTPHPVDHDVSCLARLESEGMLMGRAGGMGVGIALKIILHDMAVNLTEAQGVLIRIWVSHSPAVDALS
jgi:hypothetical protein